MGTKINLLVEYAWNSVLSVQQKGVRVRSGFAFSKRRFLNLI